MIAWAFNYRETHNHMQFANRTCTDSS
jgi:SAGA-associated factor 29